MLFVRKGKNVRADVDLCSAADPSHCCVYPSQTVNSWLFAAARTPSQRQCVATLDKYMKPFKPQAYASLMARDPKQWAHWAQPLEVVCADQVTSNGAESTMNMIGHAVRRYAGGFLLGFLLGFLPAVSFLSPFSL